MTILKMKMLLLNLIVLQVVLCNGAPVPDKDMVYAMAHLEKLGYRPTEKNATKTIEMYQSHMGIEASGVLNNETLNLMRRPHCGMADMYYGKPITTTPSRFSGKTFWYSVTTYLKCCDDVPYDQDIRSAFGIWKKYSNLEAAVSRPRRDSATIEFSFRNHGDLKSFDGPLGVAAHANSKFMHFDGDEVWTSNSDVGINFYQTAVHEIGHMLGMGHSPNKTSIMYSSYMDYQPKFRDELDTEDIENIQSMFGARTKPLPTEFYYDLLFKGADGTIYVLLYDLVIEYDQAFTEKKRSCIHEKWEFLPLHCTAAFETNLKMYFFKGNQYWRFDKNKLEPGFPKFIYEGFPGLTKVDVALKLDNSVLFFEGDTIYEYVPGKKMENYKISAKFPGVPNSLQNAIQVDNDTLYFYRSSKKTYVHSIKTKHTVTLNQFNFLYSFKSTEEDCCCPRNDTQNAANATSVVISAV